MKKLLIGLIALSTMSAFALNDIRNSNSSTTEKVFVEPSLIKDGMWLMFRSNSNLDQLCVYLTGDEDSLSSAAVVEKRIISRKNNVGSARINKHGDMITYKEHNVSLGTKVVGKITCTLNL